MAEGDISQAVLDACVLVPASLRDTLLRAAEADLYQAHWSESILAELRRTLLAKQSLSEASVERLHARLLIAFPHAVLSGFEDLIPELMNHPKDRHVLAAAVRGKCRVIVTFNVRDFPAATTAPYGVAVEHPDTFLCELLRERTAAMLMLVHAQAAGLRSPPLSITDVLAALRLHVPMFAARVAARLATDA